MQKNLHLVQEEQINSLKNKCDQMATEKDELEKDIQNLKFQYTLKSKELKDAYLKVNSQSGQESSGKLST